MAIPPWLIPVCGILFVMLIIFAIIFRKKNTTSSQTRHHAHNDSDNDSAARAPQKKKSRWSTLNDTRTGDTLDIRAAGLPANPLSLCIDRIDRYEQDGESWNEYSGVHNGQRYALEHAEGNHAWICIEEDLPLAALDLSEDELHDEDFEQCDYDGQTFHLEDCGEACYYEHSRGSGEDFYSWNFTSRNGKHSLSIEAWSGEQPSVAVSLRVDSLCLAQS